MRRLLALLVLILALAPGTWLRETLPPESAAQVLHVTALPMPPDKALAANLGAFRLEGLWQLTSPHSRFGGYSSLLPLGGGELLAIGDRGDMLRFPEPGTTGVKVRLQPIRGAVEAQIHGYDAESATLDPVSRQIWIGWESSNGISRHGLDFAAAPVTYSPAMRDWGLNAGAEAMVRLADGRFVVLREGADGWFDDRHHRGLLFAGDPLTAKRPHAFTFTGPAGFSPVDMAQLPDGRVLILMRKLVWPMPARFAGRIVLVDPAAIRPGGDWRGRVVAKLTSSLPVDNFEGLAIEPRADGKVTVWLISDANNAVTQRTLLWKLSVDPALF